jgi:DNA-binding CsgD family transcriptional regulator
MSDIDGPMISARDAYFLSLRPDIVRLRHLRENRMCDDGALALVRATIASHEGDALSAEQILERALQTLGADEATSYIIDVLVPMLISRLESKRARALLGRTPSEHDLRAAHFALLAVAEAQNGSELASIGAYKSAEQLLPAVHDDGLRGKIIGRGALAAFYLERYDEAAGRAVRAADLCIRGGAPRSAGHHYSLLVSIYRDRFDDVESALKYARVQTETAIATGDFSLIAYGLSVQIELAAEFGDARLVASLRRRLQRIPTTARFRQRVSIAVSDLLRLAWATDFVSVATRSAALREGECTDVERTLFEAFLALAAYARGLPEEAARWSSLVVAGRREASAAEQHFLRLARIIAAHVEIGSGRLYAGRRLLASSFLRGVPEERFAALVASRTLSEQDAPAGVVGYARALLCADAVAKRRSSPEPLSPAELRVLPHLANGSSAKLIAAELGTRVATVRTQIYAISVKLGTHSVAASVAEARRMGLLVD